MKKKYQYLILITALILLIIVINSLTNEKELKNNNITNKGKTLSERILNLYDVVESGSGLYKNDNKYIFKGNPNNYIKFNNELWKIVSLEEDGTIKIVRNDLLKQQKEYRAAIEFLNNEYYNSLKNKNIIKKHYYDTTYYDIGKLTSEDSLKNTNITNKELYNVGMLSVIEIANATTYITFDQYLNIFFWVNRNSNYLYTPQKWLTMTPSVYVNYDFLKENQNENAMIRPSVYLKKELKLYKGTGTKSDPYIIDNN